jgi:hypothetical protein
VGADLSNVGIDPGVTLDEYAIRHASSSASTPTRGTVVRVAAQQLAQTPTDGTPPDGPTTDGPTTDGPTTDDEPGIARRPPLSAGVRERLNAGVDQAIDDFQLDVGSACEKDLGDRGCPLIPLVIETEGPGPGDEDAPESSEQVAQRLEKIFTGTRKQDGQIIGVTVNFTVSMTGFDDGTAEIRWSLHAAKSGVPVPRDWLRLQPALSLRGEADRDSASDDFWVPIPMIKGPFFVRVGIYDDDGQRLDYADTERFR